MPPSKPPERHCSAADFLPEKPRSLKKLAAAAADCKGCDLYKSATQTVFGAGAPNARIVFVGEQPGDAEDKAGQPFVGPAGKLFDKALMAAGISREETYVTNAVKHVCLGATAAQALMGKSFKVTEHRGEFFPSAYAPRIMATVHPSSILRARDEKRDNRSSNGL